MRALSSRARCFAALLLVCSLTGSNAINNSRQAPALAVATPNDVAAAVLEGAGPIPPVVISTGSENEAEEFAAEIGLKTQQEEKKIRERVAWEQEQVDNAAKARDQADEKLHRDHKVFDLAREVVDDAKRFARVATQEKKDSIHWLEKQEGEFARLNAEAGNHMKVVEQLKSEYELMIQKYHEQVKLQQGRDEHAMELRRIAEDTDSAFKIHSRERKSDFTTRRIELMNEADLRMNTNLEESEHRISAIRDQIDQIANQALEDEKNLLNDMSKALEPLLTAYKNTMKSVQEDYLKTMLDWNSERNKILMNKQADLQRHNLDASTIHQIQTIANDKLFGLEDLIRKKNTDIMIERNHAFDFYTQRKHDAEGRYQNQINTIKKGSHAKINKLLAEVEQIKLEAVSRNELVMQDNEGRIREANNLLVHSDETEKHTVKEAFQKADDAVAEAAKHSVDVEKAHRIMMEAEKALKVAKAVSYEVRLARKKIEVDEARKRLDKAGKTEALGHKQVRDAESRVRELDAMLRTDEKLLNKYAFAVKDHQAAAAALAEVPVPEVVRKQVTEEWARKKAMMVDFHNKASEAASEAQDAAERHLQSLAPAPEDQAAEDAAFGNEDFEDEQDQE